MRAVGLAAAVAILLTALVSSVDATFKGDATYYGMNQWSGYCQGNMQAKGKAWPPNGGAFNGMRVALNAPQFGGGGTVAPCGRTLRYRGTGTGSGGNPISRSWQTAMVTNLCPECKYGSIDLGTSGDGRWGIEWEWTDGSGGNNVQSVRSSRASVPKKNFDWKKWLRIQRAKRAAAHRGRKLLLLGSQA